MNQGDFGFVVDVRNGRRLDSHAASPAFAHTKRASDSLKRRQAIAIERRVSSA